MGIADLHIHTSMSDGMATAAQLVRHLIATAELNVIAVTDHDTIDGSLVAKDIATNLGAEFEVIIGAEITTLEGHLLALFLEKPVPSFRPLADTIKAVHAQDGICIVPHPMSWFIFSVGQRAIERVLASKDPEVYLDGIETMSASPAGLAVEQKVRRLNRERFHLSETGGSDAHFLKMVGRAATLFEGSSAEDLKRSIKAGATEAAGTPWVLGDICWSDIIKQQFMSMVVSPTRGIRKPFGKLLRWS